MMQLVRRGIPLVLLFLFATCAAAQTIGFSGKVVDSVTGKPLVFATVTLLHKHQLLQQAQTDSNGQFHFKPITGNNHALKVAHIGYKKQNNIALNTVNPHQTIIIHLIPDVQQLQQVTVQQTENVIKQKTDRQIFKANLFDNAQSGTAIDVLKNIPSVTVDAQGEVSLRGSQQFLLLINGKPTQADATTVLAQLAANNIAHVEVMTNPSAKYDPDGRTGVINIVTKKGLANGYSVNANLMGGLPTLHSYGNHRLPQRFGADLMLGFKSKKWDITTGLNALRNDASGYREGNAYTIIQQVQTHFPSVGERSFNRYNYAARFAATYTPNSNNTLSVGAYVGRKHQDREADLYYTNQRIDLLQQKVLPAIVYYNANTQAKEGVFTPANADYSHRFSNTAVITTTFLYEGANLYGTTTNSNWYQQSITQLTLNRYRNPLSVYRLKLDYEQTLGKAHLEAGYQYRLDNQNGQFDYFTQTLPENEYQFIPEFSSQVRVNNHIHGLYAQVSAQNTQWYYNGGLRYEWANRQLRFGNAQQPDFVLQNVFPSVLIKYSSSPTTKWKWAYNRRIRRTANFELNPFPEREHAETLERGDAYLQPELLSLAETGLEKKLRNNASLNITAYYQRTHNIIQRLNSVYNDTILNRIFSNATLAQQWGIESNLQLSIVPWWQMMAGINLYTNSISGSVLQGSVRVNNARFTYSANTTQTFKLPKQISVQLSASYISLRPTAQGEDGAFVSPNISVKKTSTNKQFSFLLQWLNIDAGLGIANRQRITTRGNNFFTTTNYIVETDVLQIGIQYNINPHNKKMKLPAIELAEKEF